MALPKGPSNGTRKGLPCSLCKCLKSKDYRPMSTKSGFHSTLFHSPCNDCSQNINPPDCCTFCQHLRIRHLLICLSRWGSELKQYEILRSLAFELGSLSELKSRQKCPFCHFFYELITNRYQFWQEAIPGEEIPTFLQISHDDPSLWTFNQVSTTIEFSVRDMREPCKTPVTLSSKVDWGTLHGWKREYMSETSPPHSDSLSSQQTSPPPHTQNFLVIDVDSGCIVSKSRSCEYAALSYVWGSSKQGDLQASLANIRELERPGSLKQAGIPLTILDAMTVASELKIPYLWVDRYCILQDDPQTKHNLINQMGSIYASALATFVAGAGKGASYGLPGVSTGRLPRQAYIRIQDMELAEKLPAFVNDIIPRMEWNRRGWTYQEAMFSANLIFFTDYGVFYERKKSSLEILAEPPSPPTTTSVFGSIKDFFMSVKAYSGRTLSYKTDIEKAFSGVLQRSYGEEHAYGTPLRLFDTALCWMAKEGWRGARESTNNEIFPSWSWLSVMGRVDFSKAYASLGALPVATWAINLRTASGNSELRFVGYENENIEYNTWLFNVAWKAGFFEVKHPLHSEEVTAADFNSQWSPSIWKSYKSFWFQSRGLQPSSTPSQLGLPEKYPLCLRPGHIVVRTQLAHFTKELFFDYESKGHQQSYGARRGGLIALSFTIFSGLSHENDNYDDAEHGRLDRYNGHRGEWRLNVMQIRYAGDVAYRMGLGSVTLKEWKAAEPRFETIVLC